MAEFFFESGTRRGEKIFSPPVYMKCIEANNHSPLLAFIIFFHEIDDRPACFFGQLCQGLVFGF